jgi:hypothetical protein
MKKLIVPILSIGIILTVLVKCINELKQEQTGLSEPVDQYRIQLRNERANYYKQLYYESTEEERGN